MFLLASLVNRQHLDMYLSFLKFLGHVYSANHNIYQPMIQEQDHVGLSYTSNFDGVVITALSGNRNYDICVVYLRRSEVLSR